MAKTIYSFLAIFFVYSVCSTCIFARDIKVSVFNATLNQSATVSSVQLLKLSGGMQVVQTKKNVFSQAIFSDVPYIESPYLLQAKYQDVLYNTIVPPVPSQAKTDSYKVEVYERSSRFTSEIGLVVLYSFVYVEKQLQVDIYYNFRNSTQYTFSEKELGIYTYIPTEARDILASVSVGKGNVGANIQWLRITPKKVANFPENDYNYLLPYPIKPGEKTYIVKYNLRYDGSPITLDIVSTYPISKSQKVKFIQRPDNLNIQISNSSYAFAPKKDEGLQFTYYEFPFFQKKMEISISEGTPIPKGELNISQEVVLTRVIPNNIKILLLVFFLLMLLFFISQIKKRFYIFRSIMVKRCFQKEHQLEYLKKTNASQTKVKKLEVKIKNLKENIEKAV